jgi:hypothetical protein
MPVLPAPKSTPAPSFRATLAKIGRNIAYGIERKTARFAGYRGAVPTATTTIGSRIGTNSNSTWGTLERTALLFTGEMVAKNSAIAKAYLKTRANYCRPQLYKPDTGDDTLNSLVSAYCHEKWKTMGFGCSMFAAVGRTLHRECPVRGDAGLYWWRDESDDLRLIEFSADQLGEVYAFVPPRRCALVADESGNLRECPGNDCWYFAGRYFRGADPVAYKIYERTNSWYANPKVYRAADVFYVSDPENFRGMRGITIFAELIQNMQRGEDMLAAGLAAAQRQARTFGRVFNERGQPDEGTYGSVTDEWGGRQTFFQHTPGAPLEEFYYNGDNAEFTSPDSPGPELIEGVNTADERVCIGLGMTYAFIVSGEKLGGAPSRLDANRSTKEIERITNDISLPVLDRISQMTILEGVRKGILPVKANITRGHWTFTNVPTADAFKDSMDDIKSVRAGQDSNTRVAARYGMTFREIMRDKEDETVIAYTALDNAKKRLAGLGIKEQPTIADILQVSDNPQQAAQADVIDKTGKQPGTSTDSKTVSETKQAAMAGDFDESKHPRGQPDNKGEFGPGSGGSKKNVEPKKEPTEGSCDERCQKAKHHAVHVDRPIQQYADQVEASAAQSTGGVSFKDSEPVDIVIGKDGVVNHGVEFKAVVLGNNDKLTMNSYAQVRKINWEKQNKATFHTLVFDDRNVYSKDGKHDPSKRIIYYRRGVAGSARLGSLYKCKDIDEARSLMDMDEKKLPESAKRTDGQLRQGKWKEFQDKEGKGFRNIKTGEVFRAKK